MAIIKIYKYCSIETAIKIVDSGGIRLNNPDNFNDPYDSKIEISEEEEDKSFKLVNNYFIFKEFSDYFYNNNNKFNKHQKRSKI